MSAQKVLLVLPWAPDNQGGVTGVVQQIISHWGDRQALEPMLVVNDWHSPRPEVRADATYFRLTTLPAVKLLRLPPALLRASLTVWRLARFLRQHEVQAVNFHYTDSAPWGVALLKQLGLYRGQLLISYHGTDVRPASNRLENALRRYCLRQADALVACSASLADRMARTFVIERQAITVILNGVDTDVFRPDALDTGVKSRLPSRYVASVGAFIARKAHADLITAFAQAFGADPTMHLCIAGADGPLLAEVRQLISDLGLAERVHLFIGLQATDVACLLAHAEMLVQTALAESMPLAVLEAAAVGVPIAASNIPGHNDLIQDGANGRLFAVSQPEACATVMADMAAQPEATQAQGRELQQFVRRRLTWRHCIDAYKARYAGKAAPPAID